MIEGAQLRICMLFYPVSSCLIVFWPTNLSLLFWQVVVFTASLGKYADPLLDLLDKANVVRWRLFREACCPYEGSYVKVSCDHGIA